MASRLRLGHGRWLGVRPTEPDMFVLFTPFRCDDLFAQQWKFASARAQIGEVMERGHCLDAPGESKQTVEDTMKTINVASLEVDAWQLVMPVSTVGGSSSYA